MPSPPPDARAPTSPPAGFAASSPAPPSPAHRDSTPFAWPPTPPLPPIERPPSPVHRDSTPFAWPPTPPLPPIERPPSPAHRDSTPFAWPPTPPLPPIERPPSPVHRDSTPFAWPPTPPLPPIERPPSPAHRDSTPFAWPPTPPLPPIEPLPSAAGRDQRLRAISEALRNRSETPSLPPPPTGAAHPQERDQRVAIPVPRIPRFPAGPSRNTAQERGPLPPVLDLADPFLSHEQKEILRLAHEGESVFFTGSAGTGKSFLTRSIIQQLKRKYSRQPGAVAVTAPTGIAACNIGGVTIHSFAGVGRARGTAEQLAHKISGRPLLRERWQKLETLVIDEVSMLDGDLFDKLARIATLVRDSTKPFGGIQLLVTGDFFQLPPVPAPHTPVKFAFQADQWAPTITHTFTLTKVFRQADPAFIAILNEMRLGNMSPDSVRTLSDLSRPLPEGLEPAQLFPRRSDVENSNQLRLKALPLPSRQYPATDGGNLGPSPERDNLLEGILAPKTLELRPNAQVMLTRNMDAGLVNGSIGHVVRFADPRRYGTALDSPDAPDTDASPSPAHLLYPVVDFVQTNGQRRSILATPEIFVVEDPAGEPLATRTQIPLMLAWALSIHKSQGQTLDRVQVDLARTFVHGITAGQAYVALSRARSLQGLQVLNFRPGAVTAHPAVIEWTRNVDPAPPGVDDPALP